MLQANEELERARVTYGALNEQLLDELPQLASLTLQILSDCLSLFAEAQRWYYGVSLEEMYQLLEVKAFSI